MEEKISFMPKFSLWVPHLQNSFQEYGSPLQRELVKSLWEFFPDAGRRLSNGKSWLGYYFCVSPKDISAWYGFIPKDPEISHGGKHVAELIVATDFNLQLPSMFRKLTLANKQFLNKKDELHAWAIDYDKTWITPDKWREIFKDLNEQIEELLVASNQEESIATNMGMQLS